MSAGQDSDGTSFEKGANNGKDTEPATTRSSKQNEILWKTYKRPYRHLDDLLAAKPDVPSGASILGLLHLGEFSIKQADTFLDNLERPDLALEKWVTVNIVMEGIIPHHDGYSSLMSDLGLLTRFNTIKKWLLDKHMQFEEAKEFIRNDNYRNGVKSSLTPIMDWPDEGNAATFGNGKGKRRHIGHSIDNHAENEGAGSTSKGSTASGNLSDSVIQTKGSRPSDDVTISYPCHVRACEYYKSGFLSQSTLMDHYLHSHGEDYHLCDYASCQSQIGTATSSGLKFRFLRSDFRGSEAEYRSHLQDSHKEDIGLSSKLSGQEIDSLGLCRLEAEWWRCQNCLRRVVVQSEGYTCTACKTICEPAIITARKTRFSFGGLIDSGKMLPSANGAIVHQASNLPNNPDVTNAHDVLIDGQSRVSEESTEHSSTPIAEADVKRQRKAHAKEELRIEREAPFEERLGIKREALLNDKLIREPDAQTEEILRIQREAPFEERLGIKREAPLEEKLIRERKAQAERNTLIIEHIEVQLMRSVEEDLNEGLRGKGDEINHSARTPMLGIDYEYTHKEYLSSKLVPFMTIKQLGHGSFGIVDAVRFNDNENGLLLARKIIRLPNFSRKKLLPLIQQEVAVLRGLTHQHIVKVISTYETTKAPRQFGILISPVGDEDLGHFLDRVSESDFPEGDMKLLNGWQCCLASALAYVHSQNIRHKDIKPNNIICKGDQIYLTDFGSAHQFSAGVTSSTDGPLVGITKMYSAPEVIADDRRGRPADIYSLGCVFAEMATVANGERIEEFHEYRSQPIPDEPDIMTYIYHATAHLIGPWFTELGDPWTASLLHDMLAVDQKCRPTAAALHETLLAHYGLSNCPCHQLPFSRALPQVDDTASWEHAIDSGITSNSRIVPKVINKQYAYVDQK
ncbi:hypothetical protein SS1G_14489 [Sclerotinia sclerotiorum 1980 UF-70]|uniref:non-specific serine/threonine protein kinase n=1 Tax=Sclerotinia sclerotiorum (strain ATCC 18683 / 1980 / Ss-1) TaxID=665079 RepID=A7FA58_SCLS1|nr:hypothetical protein SS1G_14489 [Sclerotinia sclerotiorum 1980 UF-70]EDO00619.1 hypothetical protein SS1G_14489 [Sclerotinia sclerotiorum 1980 UF-70]